QTLDNLERRCARLPSARYDLRDEPGTMRRWRSILTAIGDDLRRCQRDGRLRLAPRPLLPRHDIADRVDQLSRHRTEPGRELFDELTRLLQHSTLRWPRQWALRALGRVGRVGAATRPTPLRRFLLGRSLHAALRWYEGHAELVGEEAGADGLAVAAQMVTVLRGTEKHTANLRTVLDKLRVAAFLADLRGAATRHPFGVPRRDRYVVFVDNAHQLVGTDENLVHLILDERRRSGPDPLLLVVTTDRRLVDHEAWDSSRATVVDAVSLDDAAAALHH